MRISILDRMADSIDVDDTIIVSGEYGGYGCLARFNGDSFVWKISMV